MKTTRIIISIAIIALASTTSAQWNQLKDRLLNDRYDQTAIAYTEIRDDVMIRERTVYGPANSHASHASSVDMIYEKELDMESWMTEAFDTGLEEELQLENWMTESFLPAEESLELESWMTRPFDQALGEEELQLESWMSTPFSNLVAANWE